MNCAILKCDFTLNCLSLLLVVDNETFYLMRVKRLSTT